MEQQAGQNSMLSRGPAIAAKDAAGDQALPDVASVAAVISPRDAAAQNRERAVRRRLRQRNVFLKALGFLSIAAGWQVFSIFQPSFIVPDVPTVVKEMVGVLTEDRFFFHLQQTMFRVVIGFLAAFVLGVGFGAIMGLKRSVEEFLEVHMLTALMLPGLAWAIMSFMWLGITNSAAVLAIVLVSVPIVAITIMHGTKAIDVSLAEMADAFGAGRWTSFRSVTLPQLYPYMFGAVRNGFALAWKVVVLSELLGLSNGVGYKLYEQYQHFRFRGVLAWTLLFAIVMFLIEFVLFKPVERYLNRWRPESNN